MAERTFKLEVVTPDKVVASDDQVVSIVAPGSDGYLGILANHAPLITELGIGEIDVRCANGDEFHLAAAQGFLEVAENKVTILADSAEKVEEIDLDRAKESAKRARERLSKLDEGIDSARAQASLLRAINRVRVTEKYS